MLDAVHQLADRQRGQGRTHGELMLDPYQHDDFSAVPFYESHSFHKDEASGSHILKRSDSFFDPRGRERDDAEDLFVSARSKGFPPQK